VKLPNPQQLVQKKAESVDIRWCILHASALKTLEPLPLVTLVGGFRHHHEQSQRLRLQSSSRREDFKMLPIHTPNSQKGHILRMQSTTTTTENQKSIEIRDVLQFCMKVAEKERRQEWI
jgi:hypothetical protein